MKRIIASILLVATLFTGIVSMVSCGGGKAPAKATWEVPEVGYDGSEVTITFAHTMSATKLQPTLELYIEEFNKIFPNIHVEHTAVGGYDDVVDQIKTQLTAGNQPNIAYCYPDHVALYNVAKAVVPLDNLINSTIPVLDADGNQMLNADGSGMILGMTQAQLDDFIQGYYAEGAVYDAAGTMYTLPMSKSTEALYYNKTFFEVCQKIYASDVMLDMKGNPVPVYDYEKDDKGEYKLDKDGNKIIKTDAEGKPVILAETQPNPNKGNENYNIAVPTTWDEMEVVCQKIKAIDPDCIPLGYDSEANWFITMTEQLGSGYTTLDEDNYFEFDNAENRAFVKRFHEWYQNGYVTTEEIYGSYTSGLFTSTDVQKCYMVIGSTGGASYQEPPKDSNGNPLFETAMTTPPQVDVNNPKVISQGPSLCIFKDENPQEVVASWLFVKFLTTNQEFQAEFSMKSGYAPVIKSVQENAVYKAWLEKANGYTNLTAMSVKLALDQEKAYYVSPAFNGSSKAREQVGFLLRDILVSEAEDIDAEIDRLFKKAVGECEYAAG